METDACPTIVLFSIYSEPETAEWQHEAKSSNHILIIQSLFQSFEMYLKNYFISPNGM